MGMRRSQNGEFFQQYRLFLDMHSVYLVAKKLRGCFKGKFWFSVLLLFYLEAIYLPVLKVWFTFMKCNILIICGFTKIYLYSFYIPELIRLANDVQTTQVQELLIQQKLLPHHTVKVMLKYLVRQMQAHNVW